MPKTIEVKTLLGPVTVNVDYIVQVAERRSDIPLKNLSGEEKPVYANIIVDTGEFITHITYHTYYELTAMIAGAQLSE